MVQNTDAKNSLIQTLRSYIDISAPLERQLRERTAVRKIGNNRNLSLYEDAHFFVDTGLVKKQHTEHDDVTHFIADHDFGIFHSAGLSYELLTLEPTTLVTIHAEDLTSILAQNPGLLAAYQKLLLFWAMQRLARNELLNLGASERKQHFIRHNRNIVNRVPNKDIASYLKMTPNYYSSL